MSRHQENFDSTHPRKDVDINYLQTKESVQSGGASTTLTYTVPQERKYLPTLAELVDRLSIVQLKEVKIPDHKEEYAQEIKDIVHDIDLILKEENYIVDATIIRAIIVLAQMNSHIWENESKVRAGTGDGNLELTHGINGIRNTAKNKIQELDGGRKDYKIDCLAADFKNWEISW